MSSDGCPQQDQLSAYAFGTLDEAHAREVAEHIEQCSACDQALQSLDRAGDILVAQLREASTGDPFLAETTYQQRLPMVEDLAVDPALLLTGNTVEQGVSASDLPQLREYRLLTKLGEGGMGAVYKALHTRLDKTVAVKVLPSDRLKDPEAVARFEREMKAIGRLEHPNVIRAHDAGEANGVHFLVMEYLDGADLSRIAGDAGPLSVADACELVRQAAVGLEYANQQGLVHRDIKPSNLMLTRDGQVKILDLGLALLSDPSLPSGSDLTSTGQLMGTLDYMAPEQGSDTHHVDIRADIYSLGATLYKLLGGEAPFAGPSFNTPMKKMVALATKAPPPLSDRRPDLPPQLATLIQRMLAKDPADRPATPREVAAALAPFAAGNHLPTLAAQARARSPVVGTFPGPLRKTEPYVLSERQDTVPRAGATIAAARRPPRRGRVIARIALGLTACLLTALTIYYIQTNAGTIMVELDGRDVEAKLMEGGVQIIDRNLKGERTYTVKSAVPEKLPPGKYAAKANVEGLILKVTDDGGAEFETGDFVLRRGGKVRVRVSLAPGRGETAGAAKTTASADIEDANAERRALQWAFRHGATFSYTEKASKRILQVRGPDGELPGHDYELWSVALPPDTTDADLENVRPIRSLKMLALSLCTRITDAGLERIQDMPYLNELQLYGTSISDAGLKSLSGLTGLQQLSLERTRITDKGIEILRDSAPGLTVLRTVDTGVTSVKPFLSLPRLQILDVPAFKDPQDYTRLAELPELYAFKVVGRAFKDETIKSLPQHPTLKCLVFQGCDIRGPGLGDLVVLPELQSLALTWCPLTDQSLVHLQGALNLTALTIVPDTPLSDNGIVPLHSLKRLKKLDLRKCKITASGVDRLREALPACVVTLDGKSQVGVQLSQPTEPGAGNLDRRAAEWILSLGGMLEVAVPDKVVIPANDVARLPAGAFKIRHVSLNNPKTKTDDAGLANLAGLDEIESLNLTYAGPFTIAGMRHLAGLTSLKSVTIWQAPLTDAGFAPLLALPNLETVILYDVQFTDAGLPQLAGLKNLKQLFLGDNPITDDGAAALAELQRLEFISLVNLRISDVGLERLLTLPRLTMLQLNHVDVTDAGLALIGSQTKLLNLTLDRLPVTDAGLKSLETLKSLRFLYLNDTEMTLDGAAALQRALPECSIHWNERTSSTRMAGSPDRRVAAWVVSRGGMVTMSGTGTDEIEVQTLADLPPVQSGSKVWKIFMQNARLRMFDHDLARLTPLKELESLDLYGAGHFNPLAMQFLAGFKDLKSLRLGDSSIGDEGLAHLQGLTKLEHLAVSNSKITNAGLAHLAGMKQLSSLNIGGNDITDAGAATLAGFLKLENLDLTHTSVADPGLERLLMLPALTQLSIGRTRVTEAGVKTLGARPQLVGLSLQDLPVEDSTLTSFETLTKLSHLDLRKTRVTAASIEKLQKTLPDCKIEWSAPK